MSNSAVSSVEHVSDEDSTETVFYPHLQTFNEFLNSRLDRVRRLSQEEKFCPVCQETSPDHMISVIDGCKHAFCFECISFWMDVSNKCPVCKKPFEQIERVNKITTLMPDGQVVLVDADNYKFKISS